jgi:hypothetical protein
MVVLAFYLLLEWLQALLGIAGAIGLLNLQGWGRVLSIIASVLALPSIFPFGAVIGAWGLVLLLKSKNAEEYRALTTSGA